MVTVPVQPLRRRGLDESDGDDDGEVESQEKKESGLELALQASDPGPPRSTTTPKPAERLNEPVYVYCCTTAEEAFEQVGHSPF